jgi:hypothetical protein
MNQTHNVKPSNALTAPDVEEEMVKEEPRELPEHWIVSAQEVKRHREGHRVKRHPRDLRDCPRHRVRAHLEIIRKKP